MGIGLRRLGPTATGPLLWGLVGLAGVIVLWQAITSAELVSSSSLPSPSATASAIGDLVRDARFREELAGTLRAWGTAVILAIVLAVPAGLVIGRFEFWHRSTAGAIDVFRSVPPAALIPVAISIFGLGFRTKVLLVTFAVVWLVLINTIYGVRSVDRVPILVARSLRWNRRQTFLWVVLPSAAPAIATGIRIASAIAFVVVLSSELLGAGDGVGALMLRFGETDQTEAIFGAIVVVGVIGVALAMALTTAEKRLLRWHGAHRPT